MEIEVQCCHCYSLIPVTVQQVGQFIKCSVCQQATEVVINHQHQPNSLLTESQTTWDIKTGYGSMLGPLPKAKLDQWLVEKKIDCDCQLRQTETEQWLWAIEVYPQLQGSKGAVRKANEPTIEPARRPKRKPKKEKPDSYHARWWNVHTWITCIGATYAVFASKIIRIPQQQDYISRDVTKVNNIAITLIALSLVLGVVAILIPAKRNHSKFVAICIFLFLLMIPLILFFY